MPQTVTPFFSRKKNISVSRRSAPLTFVRDFCLDDRKRDYIKLFKTKNPQHCRGVVGTSTRAVASTFKSRTSTCAVASTVKKKTVSLIVEVTVEKQRSAPGSAALELQGSGAPRALMTSNSFGCHCKRRRRFRPAVVIACLYRKYQQYMLQGHTCLAR